MKTSLLSDISTRLARTSDTPALDASVLIAHIVNRSRTWVLAHPELTLNAVQQKNLDNTLTQLKKGKPLPYIVGHLEFFSLDFDITPDVLIPRPETELLVEKAITWLEKHPGKRNVTDVGTGSGAIAVSLAVNVPDAKIIATDISSKALRVAKQNAKKHNVSERITFIECDLLPQPFAPLPMREGLEVVEMDLLCANLPYIPTNIVRKLPVYHHEPPLALDGGKDGFVLIRRLIEQSNNFLAPNSKMLLEIDSTLGKQAVQLAHDILPNANVELHQDLAGRDRLLEIGLS
jgi:release factor glutamine methyltransferase